MIDLCVCALLPKIIKLKVVIFLVTRQLFVAITEDAQDEFHVKLTERSKTFLICSTLQHKMSHT